MPKKKSTSPDSSITDYRHNSKRKNIPPAGLAAQGKVKEAPKTRYAYDPHLPPVLRFDASGAADQLPELLQIARQRPLTAEETQVLAAALQNRQPWLEWSGKREKAWFEVDPLALHIHERVSAQAILKLAARQPIQRSFFADPELEYRQAVQFYQHDVDWANRLILGDSLTVMHSLARREDLAGKVQMIYIDPPYGIKYNSNFQAEVGKRDVKDKESDLTRQPEQVRAYRDTWTLGVHSYLAYLRDRLIVARELLTDSGSIFVQISDENLHRVRMVMDEVFGQDNFCCLILYRRGGFQTSDLLPQTFDYILWYAKDVNSIKYHHLRVRQFKDEWFQGQQRWVEEHTGAKVLIGDLLPSKTLKLFSHRAAYSATGSEVSRFVIELNGNKFLPPDGRGWSSNIDGYIRLIKSDRLIGLGKSLRFLIDYDDFPFGTLTNGWMDTVTSGFGEKKVYVVQTASMIIERCLLMTTDPGDLVLDPTCGSGTTAYVAEQWGRRWITIDTSRVALALARQRLLTAKFDYYEKLHPEQPLHPQANPFVYKTVPHVTLKSIAQNQALDPLFAKWEPVLAEKLAALNAALAGVTPDLRARLQAKLLAKEKAEGKSAITDANQRRWLLPAAGGWKDWEVPFDADPDWPLPLQAALKDYRQAWRSKMDAVNAVIAASAPQETLVDQPKMVPGVLRVSGPFTVEGVQPLEETLDIDSPVDEFEGELDAFEAMGSQEPQNAATFVESLLHKLRRDGVRFPDNKVQPFTRLDVLTHHSVLHAGGEWGSAPVRRVAVRFGPQYGPVTAAMVEEALRAANRAAYDDLVIAGFAVDGAAQALIQDDPNPQVRCHLAHIRPDVAMGDLLKDSGDSQLFTVFGLPRVALNQEKNGEFTVEMQGVDIYDPVGNTIVSTGASKVAAWFLDSDYDGCTFCVSQAFFPDSSAWEKLARALKTLVDPERFVAFSGTRSLPFEAGRYGRIAVKVIDPRGNEVMRVMRV